MKDRILSNQFIEKLLINTEVDEKEYVELCDILRKLAVEWKDEKYIEKEIVNLLYQIPVIVRNKYLFYSDKGYSNATIDRLEDMWIELDGLILECLS